MNDRRLNLVKILSVAAALVLATLAGLEFRAHRTFREPTVLGPGVTRVAKLGDYFPGIRGTINDCNVYVLDSGKPGGAALVIGGTHPEEPSANLTAQLLVETAVPTQGKLFVALRANRSASTVTRPGEAYPLYYRIPTPWGERVYRMGDRNANPLDSWPDPEVYVHYPSGQMLAYMDIRNLNRCWPGKPDGLLVERTTYAFSELIRKEKVDLAVDFHEAELEYPVINTIVAHEKAQAVAAMSSMTLSAQELPVPIAMEFSPAGLHGLSHREIGDHTDAMSVLFESPEPFLDRVRGVTDEHLLLTGKDPFVMAAGAHKLLYAPIDENGWPIDVRVGRHVSTLLTVLDVFSQADPAKAVAVQGVPRYKDVVDRGIGAFLQDPSKVPADRVAFD